MVKHMPSLRLPVKYSFTQVYATIGGQLEHFRDQVVATSDESFQSLSSECLRSQNWFNWSEMCMIKLLIYMNERPTSVTQLSSMIGSACKVQA